MIRKIRLKQEQENSNEEEVVGRQKSINEDVIKFIEEDQIVKTDTLP